jgi:hypothetical protein
MASPFKQMGYLMVDHRASPGLPEETARLVGYDPKFAGEGKVYEVDTLTCSHCKNSVVPNHFRTRPRARCFECDAKGGHYICDICAFKASQPDYVHTPFEKTIETVIKQELMAMGTPSKLLLPT